MYKLSSVITKKIHQKCYVNVKYTQTNHMRNTSRANTSPAKYRPLHFSSVHCKKHRCVSQFQDGCRSHMVIWLY